jgi:hypothetical protein
MSEPTIAVVLLERFCRDESLAGDILEEYQHRRSRAWLWRQVAVAVLLGLPYGLLRRPRSSARMPMPVGGIGLIAIVILVTAVSPGAWWLIGVGLFGGVFVAAALIAAGRRRPHAPDRRGNILLR